MTIPPLLWAQTLHGKKSIEAEAQLKSLQDDFLSAQTEKQRLIAENDRFAVGFLASNISPRLLQWRWERLNLWGFKTLWSREWTLYKKKVENRYVDLPPIRINWPDRLFCKFFEAEKQSSRVTELEHENIELKVKPGAIQDDYILTTSFLDEASPKCLGTQHSNSNHAKAWRTEQCTTCWFITTRSELYSLLPLYRPRIRRSKINYVLRKIDLTTSSASKMSWIERLRNTGKLRCGPVLSDPIVFLSSPLRALGCRGWAARETRST